MTTITKIFQTQGFSQTLIVSAPTPDEALSTLKEVEFDERIQRIEPKIESKMRMDA